MSRYQDDDDIADLIARRRAKAKARRTALSVVMVCGSFAVAIVCIGLMIRHGNRVRELANAPPAKPPATAVRTPAQFDPDVTNSDDTPHSRRQPDPDPLADSARAAGAGAAAGLTLAVYVLLVVAWLSFWFLMTVWIMRDARNRSVDNAYFWGMSILAGGLMTCVMGFVFVVLYLASRPNGSLIRCERCGSFRLAIVGVCPHCRQPVQPRGLSGEPLL